MRLNTLEQCPLVQPARKGFRGGSIGFRDLMLGQEGSPNNYGLQMVHIDEAYFTPQHRHNFEQVRIMLEGAFSFGPGLEQLEGSVGYFCEGTYYTQKDMGKSITLLLQIGGPSKQGFMSRGQLRQGVEALAAKGNFADGVFTWNDAQGKKHNQDSYEATWEHVHDRPVHYPKPQYRGPVLLEPARFTWREIAPGVQARHFGTFNEYGLGLAQLRMQAGKAHKLTSHSQQLVFCQNGAGMIKNQSYAKWTTAQLDTQEAAMIEAKRASEFFVFSLPDFSV
jgi:hypothetical protein